MLLFNTNGPNYDNVFQAIVVNGKCEIKTTICSKQNECQPKYGKFKNIKIGIKKKS